MEPDVRIRIADLSDLPMVQELNAASFENDAAHDPHLVMSWPHDEGTGAAYFRNRIEAHGQGTGICLVAERDDLVVGYLAGALRSNESYRRGSRSELENMFVRPQARRRHVGTMLIDAFKSWSTEHGADELYVSAYFDNTRAVSFYMSNGFTSYAHDLLLDLRGEVARDVES